MAINTVQKDGLNGMCAGAANALLGTALQTAQTEIAALQGLIKKSGKVTVTAGQQTAGSVAINTGATVTGFIVQVYRAGVLLGNIKASAATTILTVETNSTDYVVTTGDVINYITF